MRFRVEIHPQVPKQIRRLAVWAQPRLFAALEELGSEPLAGKPLKGRLKGRWSLRVGEYRVVYEPDTRRRVVNVLDVGDRREVYR